MADSAFTARASTREHVLAKLTGIELPTNSAGQYSHDDAAQWIKTARRHLRETYNPDAGGSGMEKLFEVGSRLAGIKTTDSETISTVLKRCKAAADAKKKATPDKAASITPLITDREEARKEADRLNVATQAVIGAKKGAANAITTTFGSAITDPVRRNADGKDQKGIDEYSLPDLLDAITRNATRPQTADILDATTAVLQTEFDFRQTVTRNMEVLRAEIERLSTFGVAIDNTQIALILISNVERASKERWGRDFRDVTSHVRRTYAYDHGHDAASIADIMNECRGADDIRDVRDAPAPATATGRGTANSVADSFGYLDRIIREEEARSQAAPSETDDDDDYGSAAAATSGSDSSTETRRDRKKKKKSKKDKRDKDRGRDRGRSSSRRGKSQSNRAKDNPCRHCRKHHRRRQHPNIPEDRCFWNKKYKGYRPRMVADELGVPFKPREKFTPELGGYPPYSDTSSSDSD